MVGDVNFPGLVPRVAAALFRLGARRAARVAAATDAATPCLVDAAFAGPARSI